MNGLPSLDEFYDSGSVFGQEEEDNNKDGDGDGLQERDKGEGIMMTTATTVATGGRMLKDDETRTSL